MGRFYQHLSAIETLGGPEQEHSVTKDLTQVLRNTIYSITDTTVFDHVPASETEVHNRIEAVLRCIFPDLKRKPALTKPIKNFEPDTGIPSLATLIEYKFIRRVNQVAAVADEVLADTRGYSSKDWDSFIYVVYETRRFRPEHEWLQLLRECGVASNTSLIVLSGEPSAPEGTLERQAKMSRT